MDIESLVCWLIHSWYLIDWSQPTAYSRLIISQWLAGEKEKANHNANHKAVTDSSVLTIGPQFTNQCIGPMENRRCVNIPCLALRPIGLSLKDQCQVTGNCR